MRQRNKRHLNRTHEELSSTALAEDSEHCSAVSPAILCPVGLCVRGGAGRRAGGGAHVAEGQGAAPSSANARRIDVATNETNTRPRLGSGRRHRGAPGRPLRRTRAGR